MDARIAVIGAGAWGTALAQLLARKGEAVSLWVLEPELAERIAENRENDLYLPGETLSENVFPGSELSGMIAGKKFLVFVVPSQFLRKVVEEAVSRIEPGTVIVSCSKGIEEERLVVCSEILDQVLRSRGVDAPISVLSGPSFAKEVVRGVPTAVVSASREREAAEAVQKLFTTPDFRVYTNPDPIGVQVGGALKNVMAIATGIADGLGLGYNTRAALITRGLAEMARLGVRLGANPLTFSGLAGMGDLVLTCTGDLSRNRQVGLALAQGKTMDEIVKGMRAVAEGVGTVKAARALARKVQEEMPIVEQVYLMLYEGKDARQAVVDLMGRSPKYEHESIGWGWPE